MKVIGLTGGIGSGKSTIAKMFIDLGIPVYFSDLEAKILMQKSKIIKRKLIQKFGEEVYENNMLNKPFLANIIFNDKEALQYVSSVVHPKVNQHFKRWIKKQQAAYIIQENAILFENGTADFFDYIIVVTAPKKTRIERVMKRDKILENQVLERMHNQWKESEKIKKSDFIIENIDLKKAEKKVLQIHKKLKAL